MPEYSIVIPAYNEAAAITGSLSHVTSFMDTFCPDYEVVVVNDGSKDDTANIVRDFSRTHPTVRLIDNPHKGKGPTLWTGVMGARGKYIYIADTDMSAPISELKKLSVWIKDHDYDIVIGSREGFGAERINEPFYRHLMGRVFNLWVQMVALPGIKDSQCGFKLFKSEVAKDVFSRLQVYGESAQEIEKAYMGAFDVEVLYLALKMKYKVKEIPVIWKYAKTARLNPLGDSIKMARDVVKVRINDLMGVYKRS